MATVRAKAGDPAGCERVIDRAEERGVVPDTRVFAAAVEAWVKSRDKDKQRRALRLLKHAVANHEARGAPETPLPPICTTSSSRPAPSARTAATSRRAPPRSTSPSPCSSERAATRRRLRTTSPTRASFGA